MLRVSNAGNGAKQDFQAHGALKHNSIELWINFLLISSFD